MRFCCSEGKESGKAQAYHPINRFNHSRETIMETCADKSKSLGLHYAGIYGALLISTPTLLWFQFQDGSNATFVNGVYSHKSGAK